MQTKLECIPCMIRQTLSTLQLATNDEALKKKTLKEVLALLANLDYSLSPPEHGREIYEIIHTVTGNSDPYAEVKKKYNHELMTLYPQMQALVRSSRDVMGKAAKLAAAGNIIDFGPSDKNHSTDYIMKQIAEPWGKNHLPIFKEEIQKAGKILYLADNAGEIVLDRLFIETLLEMYPHLASRVTVVVRGAPIINDATIEDAKQIGLHRLVHVVENGDRTPGTVLSRISPQVRKAFYDADLVIAKGMGNYETLNNIDRTIYFLLRIKCPPVAELTAQKVNDLVFVRKPELR